MIKREEIANPDSCLNRAEDDEPIFVLRAHDKTAPSVIRAWANGYVFEKGGLGKMNPRELEKYNAALDIANKAENWRREHRL
jgi:hypothetical protein